MVGPVRISEPDFAAQWMDPQTGQLTPYGYRVIKGLVDRTGGAASDGVAAAAGLAAAAVPQTRQIIAAGGLQLGGDMSGNIPVTLYVAIDGVSNLPTSGLTVGDWAYALDGRKPSEGSGAGTGVPVFWSNASWISVCSGAAVTT
jgi:hypothetical protein